MNQEIAKILILAGALLLIFGTITYFAGGLFSWFGKLPGDIRIQKEGFTIFIPITTMIVMSAVLTIVVRLFK